jgi:hypothetical protein
LAGCRRSSGRDVSQVVERAVVIAAPFVFIPGDSFMRFKG